ncbi:MAG: T9SS type A sorting domain-containing protein [Bacteroidota bacterium]
MKTHFLFYLALVFYTPVLLALSPQTPASLYCHMVEVNKEWLLQAPSLEDTKEISFTDDNRRIRQHLILVERHLRATPVDHLSPQQQTKRSAALDALQQYWQRGQFPHNDFSPQRSPIFVDRQGTACAVAHLLVETKGTTLVEQIQAQHNHAYLPELLQYAELSSWAEDHGFTPQELAWIQPGYSIQAYLYPATFGNGLGVEGGIVRTILAVGETVYFAGNFEQINGQNIATIAAWNGNAFSGFPPLLGDGIYQLAIDEESGDLYAIGQFYNFSEEPGTVLLIRYRNGIWEPLLNSQEISTNVIHHGSGAQINDITCWRGKCYLGGNFTDIGGQSIPHLAVLDTQTDEWHDFSSDYLLTGPINEMDRIADTILVGGDFLLINDADTLLYGYAMFQLNDPQLLPHSNYETNVTTPTREVLNAGFKQSDTGNIWPRVLWNRRTNHGQLDYEAHWMDTLNQNNTYYGFFAPYRALYGYFDFSRDQVEENYYSVYAQYATYGVVWPDLKANGPVTVIAEYQDQFIIAGCFSSLAGQPFNDIVIASMTTEPPTSLEEQQVTAIQVHANSSEIILTNSGEAINELEFHLYNLNGQRVYTVQTDLMPGSQSVARPPLPSAVYIYCLNIGGKVKVGKLPLLH